MKPYFTAGEKSNHLRIVIMWVTLTTPPLIPAAPSLRTHTWRFVRVTFVISRHKHHVGHVDPGAGAETVNTFIVGWIDCWEQRFDNTQLLRSTVKTDSFPNGLKAESSPASPERKQSGSFVLKSSNLRHRRWCDCISLSFKTPYLGTITYKLILNNISYTEYIHKGLMRQLNTNVG